MGVCGWNWKNREKTKKETKAKEAAQEHLGYIEDSAQREEMMLMSKCLMFFVFIALICLFMLACGDGNGENDSYTPRPTADYSEDNEAWWPK